MMNEEMETLDPVKVKDVEARPAGHHRSLRRLQAEGSLRIRDPGAEDYIA